MPERSGIISSDSEENVNFSNEYSRKRKRRLRNSFNYSFSESHSSSLPLSPNSTEEKTRGEETDENAEKPKSKYKIHNPKNSELPQDVFFTQPPDRSSSPYRIDQFNWQKRRPPSPTIAQELSIKEGDLFQDTYIKSISDHDANTTKPSSADPQNKVAITAEFDEDADYEEILADLPANTFSSSEGIVDGRSKKLTYVSSQQDWSSQTQHKLIAPSKNLKQITLFGTQAQNTSSQSQTRHKSKWPMANREEPVTHHVIDRDSMRTWVYPTNLGSVRDYQYSIVARALYHNMLVALPTGLGKTLIAAVVMLNWFRWTTSAQIVFVAPTKPLVSQQVKACFEIAGIPRSSTTLLTGATTPGLRAEEWRSKRVFFMTPQTLINDLKSGICDPKRLVLIVVDEAHRATGGYAYVEVVKFVKRFNTSFRVLALTATPGASIEAVQEVIDGLSISRIEIRTEESLDIRQYVHPRSVETILFDNSDEMCTIMDLFSQALQPVVDKLVGLNAYWNRDPMNLTIYGCLQAKKSWYQSAAGQKAPGPLKGMVMTIFGLLGSISHAIELLKYHGVGPFYHKILPFTAKNDKHSRQVHTSQPFQVMMSRMRTWTNNPGFVGHPKLDYLQSVVLNHFLDAGEGRGASDPSNTRIMVFSHYRDSAEEISRVLKRNEPMIRPHVFVGQSSTKDSEGMDQKTQLEIIQKFHSGVYNTLIATSIGEEGLDIGEVDLIVCYDASASPIRMLQRMGRTGRKRSGNIVVLLMKGKEETNFTKAKDNYEKMQLEIASGAHFTFHEDESRRIVPKDIQPVVDKCRVDIPVENTQADLPEPKKKGRPPKRPPKKFHMPDGVRTGFTKASRLDEFKGDEGQDHEEDEFLQRQYPNNGLRSESPEPLPELEEVLLTKGEERLFERKYLDIKSDTSQIVEVPRFSAFPDLHRFPRQTKHIVHGRVTNRMTKALTAMHLVTYEGAAQYEKSLHSDDKTQGQAQAKKRAVFLSSKMNRVEVNNVAISSSTDEPDEGESLSNPTGNAYTIGPASSKIPPPVSATAQQPIQARPTAKSYGFASDDELPDIDTIVDKIRQPEDKTQSQRRGGRRVFTEDSDDE